MSELPPPSPPLPPDTSAAPPPARLCLEPGGLLRASERVRFTATAGGGLVLRRGLRGGFAEIARARLAPTGTAAGRGGGWEWTPPECGMWLAEFTTDGGEVLRRPFAVVTREWAVCQITVGAFTSEDFADIIHPAGVAADYYVTGFAAGAADDFTCSDPRWAGSERLHGDAIHPHVMADAFGAIAPALAHDDPNWDSLPPAQIDARLAALQGWWLARGFAPLDRVASYTPSNRFVEACARAGIGVLHSLVPEQNWSDGDWSINHWGMPTCPFWIAGDDYRKAGSRDGGARPPVLGMTMNHYHVLAPHLTHWGDFVLSPSHFTRWLRAADSGGESRRFRQFLADIVRGGTPVGDAPFFFVAGFEFGRTFGTADMTAWNRAGLRRLLALAQDEKLVFATSGDVRAYHQRHVPVLAQRVFRQRDSWVGVTVNGKPGQAGDSIVLELDGYKALIREDSPLPWLYYDYRERWAFATNDTAAPRDHAAACAAALRVDISPARDRAIITAAVPLPRAIPFALWDAAPVENATASGSPLAFRPLPLAPLDDARAITLLEAPAGWSGHAELALRPLATRPGRVEQGRWRAQAFGRKDTGETDTDPRHVYLHLDAPLIADAPVQITLRKPARVEGPGAAGDPGPRGAGPLTLVFGPLKSWYRLLDCEPADIVLPTAGETDRALAPHLLPAGADWEKQIALHNAGLGEAAAKHPALAGKKILHATFCGAALPLGTRSRAEAHDIAVARPGGEAIIAREFGDGVISLGPGRAFWYHPRGLCARISGLPAATGASRWTVLLHSFDPFGLDAAYRVKVGRSKRDAGRWSVPVTPDDARTFFAFEADDADLDSRGRLAIHLATDQKQILRWWDERGFIAALHALWVAA
ncbi:hypothetical protein OH491_02295 [Termitidicoccus mucosus]|uniref:Uncharacterized protein n=1 Tax=Termitidicoccus mucosus TaxID=1184151 RepID=A0A178IL25_9BACT|nr:hypothetical protein AW736_07260 [Opitutaceae bacterium TSB47]